MNHSKLPAKINDTGIRVLELLKYMINNDININEDNSRNIPQYADIMPETYLKYFSTIGSVGLSVTKKDKKYRLCSFPQKIKLTEDDLHAFRVMCDTFKATCSDKETKKFINFAEKIKKSTDGKERQEFEKILNKLQEQNLTNSQIRQEIDHYENYLDCGQKLKITYKNESFTCEPKKIDISNGKVYLTVYNIRSAEFKTILTDLITDIEVLPVRASQTTMKQSAVFEVYNRLIENYKLRDNERIESFNEKSKTIVATDYNKDELLKRLLKYGENCKIIRPKFLQQEFLAMLNDIKENLNGAKNEENSTYTDR